MMLNPSPAKASFAKVWHRRNHPTENSFVNTTTFIWIDPARPEELLDRSRLWGDKWFHPIKFRATDYLDESDGDLGVAIRKKLSADLEVDVSGELRMITQPRVLWWLFNPITIYISYNHDGEPQACLLEVTNTPWKEKHLYSLILEPNGDLMEAKFSKQMHVSPFLGMDYNYQFLLEESKVQVNVLDSNGDPIVETALSFSAESNLDEKLSRALYRNFGSTMKTSASIHLQALRLWLKRVPFVSHPRRDGTRPDK